MRVLRPFEIEFCELVKSALVTIEISQDEVAAQVTELSSEVKRECTQPQISKWKLKKERVPKNRARALGIVLKIQESLVNEYIEKIDGTSPFIGGTLADFQEMGFSLDEIFAQEQLIYSEELIPKPEEYEEGSNDFGELNKWDYFQKNYPDNSYLIMDRKSKRFIAYWHVMPITDEIYNECRDGLNINKKLANSHTYNYFMPRDHKLYFVDLFRLKKHANPAVDRLILNSFLYYLLRLAKYGHFIESIIAHTSSINAENYCEQTGFEYITDHDCHVRYKYEDKGRGPTVPTKIYEIDMTNSKHTKTIFNYSENLKLLYKKHFNYA